MSEKFPSRYSNGKMVSGAQYVTEVVCENRAKKEGKDLHFRFWLDKYWSKFFRNQIASANKLLKQYDAVDIFKALKTEKGSRIFSLRAPHLPAIIEEQQKKRMLAMEKKPVIDRVEDPKSRKHTVKNILQELEDIDNVN